jgi:hypothetical protein
MCCLIVTLGVLVAGCADQSTDLRTLAKHGSSLVRHLNQSLDNPRYSEFPWGL